MRKLIFALALISASTVLADDIIVMRNGDLINAIISEITQNEIKYKKASRPDGPLYTIDKADVLSINYEDGEKETFDVAQAKTKDKEAKKGGLVSVSVSGLSESAAQANTDKINFYNQPIQKYPDEKEDGKKCGFTRYRFFVDENSVIENDDIEIILTGVSIKRRNAKEIVEIYDTDGEHYFNPGIRCSVRNKTANTIYLDLGNCFFTRMGMPICYYTPSSTTTNTSSSKGAGVNLGAVAGAVGIGGALGTLASGVNVGGGSTSGTSNTVYAQRVIAVPPMSTYALPEMLLLSDKTSNGDEILAPGVKFNIDGMWEMLYNGKLVLNFPKKSAQGQLKYNETVNYTSEDSPLKMGFVIAYSDGEAFECAQALPVNIYLGEVVGVHRRKAPFGDNNTKKGLLWFTGVAHDKDKEPSARR